MQGFLGALALSLLGMSMARPDSYFVPTFNRDDRGSAETVGHGGHGGRGTRFGPGSGEDDDNGPAVYEFAYEMRDDATFNYQARREERDGDDVKGQYQYVGPDGFLYLVTYGDDGQGFYADVDRKPQKIFDEEAFSRRDDDRRNDDRSDEKPRSRFGF
ncbi:unnamed protein product [Darwinula stevensoni]|uniref:Uncharacterized protein n=1 Tax=Darwinula stevensoni TaxID=69355 RepID=A0A7R9A4J9_9CRUS|nr:unnamed protein product [Darwinula stevensoni]CAG0890193.1 unnamed protein product [Darwinula stevensoni]